MQTGINKDVAFVPLHPFALRPGSIQTQ